ncbi:MAG: UDP-N-acetylenolpyruvoylglucosamine reductase [Desulfobacteraceae bacterium 4572_123]|nr:MAG: UDP-N-acetylenolpyruvoylglucosamine reductase [Desulfobacteraceae bacterium 4572_123]
MNEETHRWLTGRFGGSIRFEEPMSGYTSFKVGGPADILAHPESVEDLVELIDGCKKRKLPLLVMGGGTNTLVKDSGIRGMVVVLSKGFDRIRKNKSPEAGRMIITAMAGARLGTLCGFAVKQGLKGLSFAAGIPGSVGGAIMMNAGTASGCMADILTSVTMLDSNGKIISFDRGSLRFEYRRLAGIIGSDENPESSVIIEGGFKLQSFDTQALEKETRVLMHERMKKQPVGLPCAGCFFKNPPAGKTAGQLMEEAGLKGKRIGGAQISTVHANFIVNRDNACAADILALMEHAQQTVFKKFGIRLQPEVKIVGA